MGSGVSKLCKFPDYIDRETCKEVCGIRYDEEKFLAHAVEDRISKTSLLKLHFQEFPPSHIVLSSEYTTSQKCMSEGDNNVILSEAESLVQSLFVELKNMNLDISISEHGDKDDMSTVINKIEKTSLVIVCLSQSYANNMTCFAEANYAKSLGSEMIFVEIEKGVAAKADGWIANIMQGKRLLPGYEDRCVRTTAKAIYSETNSSLAPLKIHQTYLMPNGDEFTGPMVNGRKKGFGKYIYCAPNEQKGGERVYEGQYLDDMCHGKGTFLYPNGDVYTGDFEHDIYSGRGKYLYGNGDSFEGQYRSGRRNGYGVSKYVSGDKYSGMYLDDKYSGKGKYTWHDGAFYEGEYFNDMMHGFGKLTEFDGVVVHEGRWEMGEPEDVIFF